MFIFIVNLGVHAESVFVVVVLLSKKQRCQQGGGFSTSYAA